MFGCGSGRETTNFGRLVSKMATKEGNNGNEDFKQSGIFMRKSTSGKSLIAFVDPEDFVKRVQAIREETGEDGKILLSVPVRFAQDLISGSSTFMAFSMSSVKKKD